MAAPAPVEQATVEVVHERPLGVPAVEVAPPAVPSGPPTLRVVPHPEPDEPAAEAEPAADEAEPATPEPVQEPVARVKRAAGQRASVPSWSDVLLGTGPVDPPRGGRTSD